MKRIKSGDTVKVRAGKHKTLVGKVLRVSGDYVFVEGVTLKKAIKPNPNTNQQGGIVDVPARLHVSNVAIYNTVTQSMDKVGFRFVEKNGLKVKVRYFKSNNELIDIV